ncbi:hypothetical protein DNH61_11815 [Paenibacillus sambharensis]|uniref:Uncharacterized protein n=1 Tax=Paenibacillus sambharensis TaxID=1803190 RepID=A0A2W1LAS6_9BACL|nr:hypothetical protein [Paenibacillus sambharensis]PZD95240.1 hypothetical protein DNH61_11815 [Paenibacillus sambharensis]
MANLPSNRTKLQAAVTNQQPTIVASSQANREAMIEAYDTIDLLNQKVDGLAAGGTLSPLPPDFMHRQALINSNMDVWQRGTSFTSAGFGPDRLRLILNNGATITSHGRSTDVPNVQSQYSYEINVTNTGGGTGVIVRQIVEAQHYMAGKQVTLSGWIKGPSGATVFHVVNDEFNAGTTMTGAWIPFMVTGTVTSTGNLSIDPIRNASLPGTYRLSQLQFCTGGVALPYQPRGFADEFRLCLRYYEKNYGYLAYAGTSNQGNIAIGTAEVADAIFSNIRYTVPKRARPTVLIYSFGGTANRVSPINSTTTIGTNVTVVNDLSNEYGFSKLADTAATFTVGSRYWFNWVADAEI